MICLSKVLLKNFILLTAFSIFRSVSDIRDCNNADFLTWSLTWSDREFIVTFNIWRVWVVAAAGKTTLETSEEDDNYTRNEWRRWQLHSKRVKKMTTTPKMSAKPHLDPYHLSVFLCHYLFYFPIFQSQLGSISPSEMNNIKPQPNRMRTLITTVNMKKPKRKL